MTWKWTHRSRACDTRRRHQEFTHSGNDAHRCMHVPSDVPDFVKDGNEDMEACVCPLVELAVPERKPAHARDRRRSTPAFTPLCARQATHLSIIIAVPCSTTCSRRTVYTSSNCAERQDTARKCPGPICTWRRASGTHQKRNGDVDDEKDGNRLHAECVVLFVEPPPTRRATCPNRAGWLHAARPAQAAGNATWRASGAMTTVVATTAARLVGPVLRICCLGFSRAGVRGGKQGSHKRHSA